MISRELSSQLLESARRFPVVSVIGPRQSGKTTLVKALFSDYKYVSLEDLDNRKFAGEDPRNFLDTYPEKVILDEVQRVPELFSYLQTHTDQKGSAGQYILTGSQHFLMMESVSQTLAGRTAIHTLLPLSWSELSGSVDSEIDYTEFLFAGSFPRVYDKKIPPSEFYSTYIQTYVERDVRTLKQVSDLTAFQTFVKLCAGRIGQLLNLSSLANDAGITHNTAKSWLSLLETSFLVVILKPHHKNFNKRLIKSPKLYFTDTGLAASLLEIETPSQLATHHMVGHLFENMVVTEYLKHRYNQGKRNNGFFWRDKTGHEIDLLIEKADKLISIEVKSGKTVNSDYFRNLKYWQSLSGSPSDDSYVIYGGDSDQKRSHASVCGWKKASHLFQKI
ncbi:MAG: ATP-binding protein [Balneolaceae bacterium]